LLHLIVTIGNDINIRAPIPDHFPEALWQRRRRSIKRFADDAVHGGLHGAGGNFEGLQKISANAERYDNGD